MKKKKMYCSRSLILLFKNKDTEKTTVHIDD